MTQCWRRDICQRFLILSTYNFLELRIFVDLDRKSFLRLDHVGIGMDREKKKHVGYSMFVCILQFVAKKFANVS